MLLFRTADGNPVSELSHTLKVLRTNPTARIYVGCDSQNKKRYSYYVVVIAYRYGQKGAHYIYSRYRVPKIRDRWSRLWKEVELSKQVADKLRDSGIEIYSIDLDYNKDKTAGSHSIVQAATGYCIGSGYRVSVKPEEQVACRAADHLVR